MMVVVFAAAAWWQVLIWQHCTSSAGYVILRRQRAITAGMHTALAVHTSCCRRAMQQMLNTCSFTLICLLPQPMLQVQAMHASVPAGKPSPAQCAALQAEAF
jgi:hypothetical protein